MPRKAHSTNSGKNTPKKTTSVKTASAKRNSVVQKPIENTSTSTPVVSNARNPRLWVGLAIVILAILAFAFKGFFVAAVVNGQPISRIAVIQQLEKQNGKQAVNSLITQTLISQEAEKRHVTVSQADVNNDLKKIDDALKAQGQSLDVALAARGLSKQELVQQITLQKMIEKMVGKDVKVSDADVQKYIDSNQDTLPKDLSDTDLRKQVRQQLEQQQLQTKTQTFVSDLQKKAKISYYVNY